LGIAQGSVQVPDELLMMVQEMQREPSFRLEMEGSNGLLTSSFSPGRKRLVDYTKRRSMDTAASCHDASLSASEHHHHRRLPLDAEKDRALSSDSSLSATTATSRPSLQSLHNKEATAPLAIPTFRSFFSRSMRRRLFSRSARQLKDDDKESAAEDELNQSLVDFYINVARPPRRTSAPANPQPFTSRKKAKPLGGNRPRHSVVAVLNSIIPKKAKRRRSCCGSTTENTAAAKAAAIAAAAAVEDTSETTEIAAEPEPTVPTTPTHRMLRITKRRFSEPMFGVPGKIDKIINRR